MCELLALSSNLPASVDLSLAELARRGGLTGPHRDGFGIAYYEDGDWRLIRDQGAAHDSPWVQFVSDLKLEGQLVIAHVRKAEGSVVALRNTHPFSRELQGHRHVFAHNGELPDLADQPWAKLDRYHPVGETDTELAFCVLMERLRPLWTETETFPSLEDRFAVVAEFAADIGKLGPANFVYSDGDTLFAHGNKRTQADKTIRPPGLHVLERTCNKDGHCKRVVLVASNPITDNEDWQPLSKGEVLAVRRGEIVKSTARPGAIVAA